MSNIRRLQQATTTVKPKFRNPKSIFLAELLSFIFIGAGQLYNGEWDTLGEYYVIEQL